MATNLSGNENSFMGDLAGVSFECGRSRGPGNDVLPLPRNARPQVKAAFRVTQVFGLGDLNMLFWLAASVSLPRRHASLLYFAPS